MFGLGFGEMVLILIVGIVVVGPRQLPTLMRTAGKWVSKLRRLSTDLRSQSGIDDLIRQEGLEKEIQELRALSRVNVIDTLVAPAVSATAARPRPAPAPRPDPSPTTYTRSLPGGDPRREREYPEIGCDSYDAVADDVYPYGDEPADAAEAPPSKRQATDPGIGEVPPGAITSTPSQAPGPPVAAASAVEGAVIDKAAARSEDAPVAAAKPPPTTATTATTATNGDGRST